MKAVGWEAGGWGEGFRRVPPSSTWTSHAGSSWGGRHMGTGVAEIRNSKKCAVSRLRIKRAFLFKWHFKWFALNTIQVSLSLCRSLPLVSSGFLHGCQSIWQKTNPDHNRGETFLSLFFYFSFIFIYSVVVLSKARPHIPRIRPVRKLTLLF